MISICIPVYNLHISELIKALEVQMVLLEELIEIVVIDDASDSVFKEQNGKLLKKHNYIELINNVGRSKIRNLFLEHTQYDNLLFLDCDSQIVSSDFLEKYIKEIKKEQFDVVYGGLVCVEKEPKRNFRLRWEFGRERESVSVEKRRETPFISFKTCNFLVKRVVFKENPFDEKLTKYGHEDTLFGFELKSLQKRVVHINNPVLHNDKDDNFVFLMKSEMALENLQRIVGGLSKKDEFIGQVKLLRCLNLCDKYYLSGLLQFVFFLTNKILRYALGKGWLTNLSFFDLYRLGYLNQYRRQN